MLSMKSGSKSSDLEILRPVSIVLVSVSTVLVSVSTVLVSDYTVFVSRLPFSFLDLAKPFR